jgi:hypothetical protein
MVVMAVSSDRSFSLVHNRNHKVLEVASAVTDLGEILEPESQQKLKNIAEATIRRRFNTQAVPPSGERGAASGFSD